VKSFIFALLLLCASVALAQDSTVFDYTYLDDAFIYQSQPDWNYGGSFELRASLTRSILIRLYADLSYYLGENQIIDGMRVYLYLSVRESGTGISDTFQVYPMQTSYCWGEGTGTGGVTATSGATYNDWNAPNTEWGTAGCESAHDDSLFHCTDASGYDRWATPSDTPIITGTGTYGWKFCTVQKEYVQTCYDSGYFAGLLIHQHPATASKFYSTENASYRPYIVVYHHTGEVPPAATGSRVLIRK
jgi:hypothetical protein